MYRKIENLKLLKFQCTVGNELDNVRDTLFNLVKGKISRLIDHKAVR